MKKLSLALMAGVLFSSVAHAELVSTDWLSEGDSKATLDTKTGLEWLDLSVTRGKSVDQVQALLNTDYSGWKIANEQQVFELLENSLSFINFDIDERNSATSTSSYSISQTNKFISLFGEFRSSNALSANGYFIANNTGESRVQAARATYFWASYGDPAKVNVSFDTTSTGYTSDSKYHTIGLFLVSTGGATLSSINNPSINLDENGVPAIASVPLSASIGFLGLALLAGSRRKKQ